MSELEVDAFFTLSAGETAALCDRRGVLNRLDLARHPCVVKLTGQAGLSTKLVPQAVLMHVADQLDVPSPNVASLRSHSRDRSTLFRHRKPDVRLAGFCEAGTGARSGQPQDLRQKVLVTTAVDMLRGRVMRWLHARKCVVLPARDIRSLVRRDGGDGIRSWQPRSAAVKDRSRANGLKIWLSILNRA